MANEWERRARTSNLWDLWKITADVDNFPNVGQRV